MGSGLSMTSVNKIKELAAAREYSLALEIIDSQDLSKSLNPQFLRLCGEVYIANKRYIDARKILLMAHKMAPEAKRVIYSLVDLYLRMGYKELAEFYYQLYMYDSDPNLPETIQMNYIYDKAQGCPFEEIETLLFPMYSDVMDYDWSFELYLLMKLQGKEVEAKDISLDYIASFKNGTNATLIEAIEDNQVDIEEVFYVYSKEEIVDDSPEQEELRMMERPLLEEDELRINPKEAEIQILFDDNEKLSLGAKLKLKKHLKEEEKLAKKMQDENGDSEGSEAPEVEEQQLEVEQGTEGEMETLTTAEEDNDTTTVKVNIFKKLFSKKKSEETEEENSIEESDNTVDVDNSETTVVLTDSSDETHNEVEAETQEETDDILDESVTEDLVDENEMLESDKLVEDEVDTATQDDVELESLDNIGDSVMQEIYEKKKISIVTEFGEDTFINTQGGDFESGNPFDEIYNHEQNHSESRDEAKTSFVIEEVELQAEDDEYEVDDFSQDFEMDDFESDLDNDEKTELSVCDIIDEEDAEPVTEDAFAEEEAEAVIEDAYVEEEAEAVIEDAYVEEEAEAVIEDAYVEEEAETVIEDTYVEEEAEAVIEDAYVEEETEAVIEDEFEENEESIYVNVYEETSEFVSEEISEQEETTPVINSLEGESVYTTLQQKGKLDYPEFKSSLFPDFGESVISVENNFNEIMVEAQDKINENLLKEEQMQREAEALLASLGIDLGFSKSTINTVDDSVVQSATLSNSTQSNVVVEENNDPVTVESQIPEEVMEAVDNNGPSRDELKASLKIDSVKKSILKQIKEYR